MNIEEKTIRPLEENIEKFLCNFEATSWDTGSANAKEKVDNLEN